MRHAFAAIALSILATASSAQVSVPFTFSAGSAARASEVNSNFQALVAGINALASRVNKLEGHIVTADLVGTYAWSGLQVGLIVGGTVETISYSGTVTLTADGTLSGTLSERGFDLFPGGSRVPRTADDPLNGSWILSGSNTVTLTLAGSDPLSFDSAAGGRILVRSGNNNADGSVVLLILVRTSLLQ